MSEEEIEKKRNIIQDTEDLFKDFDDKKQKQTKEDA